MRGGIVAVDPATEHRDRRSACLERATVSLPVDSSSQPAHDHEPGGAEVAGQAACDLTAIRGAGACAHDCDSRATQQLQRAGAAQEEARRWIVDRAKERRERRLRASDEAKATLREPPQLRRAVK